MATIALYANQMKQMPGLIQTVKSAVVDYKTELQALKTKAVTINRSTCDLDNVIDLIQSSTRIQEEKIVSLDTLEENCEEFITEVERIDTTVAEVINRRKAEFYETYTYLKPDTEKTDWERFGDKLQSVGEFCQEHWKEILITAVILIAVASTIGSSTLNIIATWCDMSVNKTFKSWQTAMNWISGISSGLYSIGMLYNSVAAKIANVGKSGADVWDMTKDGGSINGREYSQHAMERMAPDTPSVRAELSRRAEALAESKGLQVGTPEYYQFCQKYVDPRNIPPSVIEYAIRNTTAVLGHTAGTFVHQTTDVIVIVNKMGKVITVIPK